MEDTGWWVFEAKTLTLSQRASGQSARFEGPCGEAWLFAYQDRESATRCW